MNSDQHIERALTGITAFAQKLKEERRRESEKEEAEEAEALARKLEAEERFERQTEAVRTMFANK